MYRTRLDNLKAAAAAAEEQSAREFIAYKNRRGGGGPKFMSDSVIFEIMRLATMPELYPYTAIRGVGGSAAVTKSRIAVWQLITLWVNQQFNKTLSANAVEQQFGKIRHLECPWNVPLSLAVKTIKSRLNGDPGATIFWAIIVRFLLYILLQCLLPIQLKPC